MAKNVANIKKAEKIISISEVWQKQPQYNCNVMILHKSWSSLVYCAYTKDDQAFSKAGQIFKLIGVIQIIRDTLSGGGGRWNVTHSFFFAFLNAAFHAFECKVKLFVTGQDKAFKDTFFHLFNNSR